MSYTLAEYSENYLYRAIHWELERRMSRRGLFGLFGLLLKPAEGGWEVELVAPRFIGDAVSPGQPDWCGRRPINTTAYLPANLTVEEAVTVLEVCSKLGN